jgi:hypothetical protein
MNDRKEKEKIAESNLRQALKEKVQKAHSQVSHANEVFEKSKRES